MKSAASPALDNDLAGVDFDTLGSDASAPRRRRRSSENLREPFAQIGLLLLVTLMLRDDLVLALLQRMIELRQRCETLAGQEAARAQRLLGELG